MIDDDEVYKYPLCCFGTGIHRVVENGALVWAPCKKHPPVPDAMNTYRKRQREFRVWYDSTMPPVEKKPVTPQVIAELKAALEEGKSILAEWDRLFPKPQPDKKKPN